MAANLPYDAGLTERIRAELALLDPASGSDRHEFRRLLDRFFGDAPPSPPAASASGPGAGSATSTPSGPASVPAPVAVPGAVRAAFAELVGLSSRLDATTSTSEGFAVGESVADRAHRLFHVFDRVRAEFEPGSPIGDRVHRLAGLLSQLIQNAVAKMQAFAKLLGVSSFAVAFATVPPQVTVTFTFGAS